MGYQEDPGMPQLQGLNSLTGRKATLQQALQPQGDAGSSRVMVVRRRAASDGHDSGWSMSPKSWSVQDLEFRR